MLSLIDRYIGRQLIISSIAVLLLLTSLQSLFSFVGELKHIGDGSYQTADALLYVGLMFPSRILDFFPMSVLIGALFSLGNMANNSELTVLRAAGMTTWRIAGSAIKASLALMLLVIFIGEWVAPYSVKAAHNSKAIAISGGGLSFSKTGLWAKKGNEIIQVGHLVNDENIQNITIYQLSTDNRLLGLVRAKSASLVNDTWHLNEVVEFRFLPDQIEKTEEESRLWERPLHQDQLDTLAQEPETLNIPGIIRYLDYLSENNLDTNTFELALWRKIMHPLVIAIMMFLATSFVFGPMREVSMGAKILSGVMLGFGFHLAVQSFGPVSLVYNVWPFVGAVMPLVLFSLLGFWLMKRKN